MIYELYCTLLTACDRPATVWCQPPKNLPEMLQAAKHSPIFAHLLIQRQAGMEDPLLFQYKGWEFSSFLLAWLNQTKFPPG